MLRVFVILALGLGLSGGAVAETDEPIAPRLSGLGELHYEVTTASPDAQAFFDQGLRLTYGFNHMEAIRAFQEASRLDPSFAMAYWGEALALGPNINDAMPHDRQLKAVAAIGKAKANAAHVSQKERDFIDALATRYTDDENADRAAFDMAYADAMRTLWKKYPSDPEAGTLFAAALMDTMPWHYWNEDLTPRPGTDEVVAALERVIADHPNHPGAHHYYIHIVEASADASRGVDSADRLAELMPGAGHLVHMPSHIYLRVGRYADASDANVEAILADEDYIAQCQAQGLYPVGYYPHNIHFLWASASLEGRSEVAIDAAEKTASRVPIDMANHVSNLQWFLVTPLYAQVRFGRWSEILTTPPPAADMTFVTAIWHYARGVAFTARGQLDRADEELSALEKIAATPEMEELNLNQATGSHILRLAAAVVAGEMAAKAGNTDEAVAQLETAVELYDDLPYMEPPTWHYPVRQSLGAVLLDAGRLEDAEAVYREDLAEWKHNGWSLFGLLQTLRAAGKTREADEVEAEFERVWSRADVTLTSSRF
jgi:tetratricopeptide (TPR) repeat protein